MFISYSLLCYIIFSLGVIFLVHFVYLFIISKRTIKWKVTEGKILNSYVENISINTEDGGSSYKANIKYQYNIDGIEYTSKRIFWGDYICTNMSWSPKKIVNKYHIQKKVTIYYHPKKFKKSVLETGVNSIIYREGIIGICFILLSILMIVKESFFISLAK